MSTVLAYFVYSSSNQTPYTEENQRQAVQAIAQEHKLKISQEYCDYDESVDGFQACIQHAEKSRTPILVLKPHQLNMSGILGRKLLSNTQSSFMDRLVKQELRFFVAELGEYINFDTLRVLCTYFQQLVPVMKDTIVHQQEEPLTLELGVALVGGFSTSAGIGLQQLADGIRRIRSSLAENLALVLGPVHLRDNIHIHENTYRLLLRGNPIAQGEVFPHKVLAINPGDAQGTLTDGIETIEPAFGLQAWWVPHEQQTTAQALGYTVVEPEVVIQTHLNEIILQHLDRIFGQREFQQYLQHLENTVPLLVEELIPAILSKHQLFLVLRNLLEEGVTIRDGETILSTLLTHGSSVKDIATRTSLARQGLKRYITQLHISEEGTINCICFEDTLSKQLVESIHISPSGEVELQMEKEDLQQLMSQLQQAAEHYQLVVLCPPLVRRALYQMTKNHITPLPAFVSRQELLPDVSVHTAALVSLTKIEFT